MPGFALEHSRGPVWVWLGWWVPIVSFWFPYQVVRDIRDASGAPRTSVLGGWWACWVVWLVAGRVAGRLIPVDDVPDPALVELLPWVETAVATALLLALVFWVQLVRDIRDAQRTALG